MINNKILIKNADYSLLEKLINKIGDPPDIIAKRNLDSYSAYLIESRSFSLNSSGVYTSIRIIFTKILLNSDIEVEFFVDDYDKKFFSDNSRFFNNFLKLLDENKICYEAI